MPVNVIEEQGLGDINHREMFRPSGYGAVKGKLSPKDRQGVLEVANAYRRVTEGDCHPGEITRLMEAQGTSQFQWYMGHILQRRTYGMYEKMRGEWRSYVRESEVPDFRNVERLWRHDASEPLPFLQEFEQYAYTGVSGDKTTYRVAKYGRLMGLSWEDIINDDLDFLSDFPQTLANSATQTEDMFVTRLYASDALINTGVFNSSNGNILAGNSELGTAINAPLSLDAIKAASFQMERQTITQDDNNLPIMFSSYIVVVPHRLSIVTDFLRGAREIRTLSGTSQVAKGSNQYEFIMDGNMLGNVRFVVNPYLDILDKDTTAWFMFGMPTNARPGIEVAYLRGYRRPQLFMRAPDSRAIGAGDTRVSFENDTMDYKIRGVFGGTVIDPRQMVASKGTGSA